MASASTTGAVVEPPKPGDLAAVSPYLNASTAAWLCALPCALVVLAAIVVLGPPLGSLLVPGDSHLRFLPVYQEAVRPEPTEQGRYLIALAAPLLLSLATIALVRRRPRLAPDVQAAVVAVAQVILLALLVACVAGQYGARYGSTYLNAPTTIGWRYFTPATLAAGAAIALLLGFALTHPRVRARASRWLRESTGRRWAASAAAVAITAIWLLHAVNTDHSVANEPWEVSYHLQFTLDEAFAVINGRTPLVDFSPQYGALLPSLGALAMLAFGKTLLVYTIAMCTLSALALLALFDVLRRAARSALAALLLYLPLLATSLFMVRGTLVDRDTFATYFGMFPLRYGGAYLLAWLTARQLERRGERAGTWALFVVAGLVLLNNVDFGVAALGACVAAILWTGPRDRRALLRLAAAIGAGLATALALVALLTLVRAGSLPQLSRLTDYARLYAGAGFALLPIRGALGLHLAIYLTYVAAIATATVRAASGAPNRVLTGMLAWSGVFGLGAGSYFVGRSHPETLIAMFSAWALALALLTIVVASRLLAQPSRRPSLGALTVLLGLGVAICSLAQTPLPWSQLSRFDAPFRPSIGVTLDLPLLPTQEAATRRFVSSLADGRSRFVVRRGAPVAFFTAMSHRTADAYGIVDVSPYTGWNSMETDERVEATLDALAQAGGNTALVPREVDTRIFLLLARRGFEVLTPSGELARFGPRHPVSRIATIGWSEEGELKRLTKWVDTRRLRAPWLHER